MRLFGRCRACEQKDAVIASNLRTIQTLLDTMKDLEAGRRGVETALASIAEARAGQAAERVMRPPAPGARPHTETRRPERRALVPWANQLAAGGHLDHRDRTGARGDLVEPEAGPPHAGGDDGETP
jgi:hypothetical protein